MLKTLSETAESIRTGKLLHIAAGEDLLRKLPAGNWIGGSTEYFLDPMGGLISGELLDITEIDCESYNFAVYGADNITSILSDAYENGYCMVIMPSGSDVMSSYARKMEAQAFMTPVVGWISGTGVSSKRAAVTVNGKTGEFFTDKAVVLHAAVPADKTVVVNIINVFKPDENSPVIRFTEDGFYVKTCLVDGVETDFAEFLRGRNFNFNLPIIGDYSGERINVTVREAANGAARLYAPVFKDIDYRLAAEVDDYTGQLKQHIADIDTDNTVFSCSCYLSYKYGNLEGKDVGTFYGPVTFGEIAYMLMNQTLVYLRVVPCTP